MGELIGTATPEKNGLMSKNELINLGNIGASNMENIKSGFGYSYGNGDGSNVPGTFLSLVGYPSIFQFKALYTGNKLIYRVYNHEEKEWIPWKEIVTI